MRTGFSLAALLLAGGLWAAPCEDPGVRITQEREGNVIHLYAEAVNGLDVTITLSAELTNMRASPALPATLESRGRRRFELGTLQPVAPGAWNFSYHYHWLQGGGGGQPDGTVYQLPFPSAARRRLLQGYHGKFSHQAGTNDEYAHDWDLPQGSVVLAARAGVVTGLRQDSDRGGPGEEFKNCANYVVLRHADGTYGEYVHLRPNGVQVKLGETVAAGQAIAFSGNTGRSSGPHLHFAVFRTKDGTTRETLPVKFRARNGAALDLEPGKSY